MILKISKEMLKTAPFENKSGDYIFDVINLLTEN